MIRSGVFIFLSVCSIIACGQSRVHKLVLKPGEVFELKGEPLEVDTLIMQDSSKILLNKLKKPNSIRVKVLIFYRGCQIDGRGMHGIKGKKGQTGLAPLSPCTDGGTGFIGANGGAGGNGLDISMHLNEFYPRGTLTIDVSGGDAGDGGTGGPGGDGGPGTRPCGGGNGGRGGRGGSGGSGGNSGNVTFVSPRTSEIRSYLNGEIVIRNYGGNLGLGGEGGTLGLAGLSPVGNSKMDGKPGRKGPKGSDGIQGKPGSINFQDNK